MVHAVEEATRMTKAPGVGQRAGILVALSGPHQQRLRRRMDRVPLANMALAGTISAFTVTMTTQPYAALERAVDNAVGGPSEDPEQSAARRRALLVGTLATVATGVLTQRMINHAHLRGPAAEAGRAVGTQLAIGGAASALVMGTDQVLGPPTSRDSDDSTSLAAVALVTLAQRRLLRRIARVVTLPPPPESITLPVKNGRRVREVQLQLMR
jgi:hypothetical protein